MSFNYKKYIQDNPLLKEQKDKCPTATQNLELNTKNRDASIKADYIKYGPLNVDEPGDYWKDLAEYWDTTEEAAKKSLCGNCVAFDISPRMNECMPGEVSDDSGRLGYCWMHNFKCHSARTCRTWAKGGPITEDKVSYDWQERKEGEVNEQADVEFTDQEYDPTTRSLSATVKYNPNFQKAYDDLEDAKKSIEAVASKSELIDDAQLKRIKELVRDAFNKYRTHLRNNYRDEYLKIKGRGGVDEMSTTGGTASFTPGEGVQYATPYAFKRKRKKSNDN